MTDEIADIIERDSRVRFAYLFGSRAKDRPRPGSDLDLAIWFDPLAGGFGQAAFDLAAELSAALRLEVDLVALNRASTLLRGEVLREGRLVFERDRAERVAYEADTLVQLLDFEPIRRRCANGMLRKMRAEARDGQG